MLENPLLHELIDRWEESRANDAEISAEELCQEHPELLEELKAWIADLKQTDWMDNTLPKGTDEEFDTTCVTPQQLGIPPKVGRYRLERLAGMGGFGQVWKGWDEQLQRAVAVKIARIERIPKDGPAHLMEEARRCARLKHPNILAIHDVGEEQDIPYFVCDWVEGETLRQRIDRQRLSRREAIDLIAQLADALQFAHDQGIVHLDVKPSNVLLDEKSRPFLVDFGLSVGVNDKPTGCGTTNYSSPEQRATGSHGIDGRSDIYALGGVFYELLTGRKPLDSLADYPGQDLESSTSVVSLRDIPENLLQVCRKCLVCDPDLRYQTATELAQDLRACLHHSHNNAIPRQGLLLLVLLLVCSLLALTSENRSASPPMLNEISSHRSENLIRRIDVPRDLIEGQWSVQGNDLISGSKGRSVVLLPDTSLPEEYKLRIVLRRESETAGPFRIGLIVGDHRTQVVINSKGASGLEQVYNKPLRKNRTCTPRGTLSRDKIHTISCRVFGGGMVVLFDGWSLVRWPVGEVLSDPLAVSLRIPDRRLYLVAEDTRYRVISVNVFPINRPAH